MRRPEYSSMQRSRASGVGPHEILATLGVGGMDEESRAIRSLLSKRPLRSTGKSKRQWKPCRSNFVLLG